LSSGVHPNPAERLVGLVVSGRWHVVERLERPPCATGGHFSVGYRVESESGEEAFLKALDFSEALASPDPARTLEPLTAAYNFERDLLKRCAERNLSRVIRVLADGSVAVGNSPGEIVQYLIFEAARADARAVRTADADFDVAWAMRAMHHAATGLQQLHSAGVAHQDLKPSNVVVFRDRSSKLADLGCAAVRGSVAPRDDCSIPGDVGYAPPELLYGQSLTEWNARLSCDLYLLGNLLGFFVLGVSMAAALQGELHPQHRRGTWAGSYSEVLPYVREAHARLMEKFRNVAPSFLKDDLVILLQELCEPKVEIRGHPAERLGSRNPFSLARYVSRFDILSRRAEMALLRGR